MTAQIRLSTSIQAADVARLADEVGRIFNSDWLHVDVMDDHFVPRVFGGTALVRSLARHTAQPLDCHLLVEQPDRSALGYVEAGASGVTIHFEATRSPMTTLRAIRAAGAEAGLALRTATPVDQCELLLGEIDTLVLLAVEPMELGSRPFTELVLGKVRRARELARRHHPALRIQIDGGVGPQTAERYAAAGADTFTPGIAVFSAPDPAGVVAEIRERAERARAGRTEMVA